MSTTTIMESDVQQKLAILGGEASDEVADVPATNSIRQGITHTTGFSYDAKQQGGGTSRLFKVLQTNRYRARSTSLRVAYARHEHLWKRRKE